MRLYDSFTRSWADDMKLQNKKNQLTRTISLMVLRGNVLCTRV